MALLLSFALVATSLCKFTIRDVGFVFIGDPLVEIMDGGIVERPQDGASKLFPSTAPLDGGPFRHALGQDLLGAVAVVVVLPGEGEGRIIRAAEAAAGDLEQMSAQGRLARPLDGPILIQPWNVEADPVGAWALGWARGDAARAAVLYGRGRLAGPPLSGTAATRVGVLAQLELVSDSCECDRPRAWLAGRHLPLPWDDALRARAHDQLGFDPHSPRIRAEMDRILARGPRPAGAASVGSVIIEDPLLGYDEVQLTPSHVDPEPSRPGDSVHFGTALFWLCVGLGTIVLCAIGVQCMSKDAA